MTSLSYWLWSHPHVHDPRRSVDATRGAISSVSSHTVADYDWRTRGPASTFRTSSSSSCSLWLSLSLSFLLLVYLHRQTMSFSLFISIFVFSSFFSLMQIFLTHLPDAYCVCRLETVDCYTCVCAFIFFSSFSLLGIIQNHNTSSKVREHTRLSNTWPLSCERGCSTWTHPQISYLRTVDCSSRIKANVSLSLFFCGTLPGCFHCNSGSSEATRLQLCKINKRRNSWANWLLLQVLQRLE